MPQSGDPAGSKTSPEFVASNPPEQGKNEELVFSRQEWMTLLVSGDHGKLCAELLRAINYFATHTFWNLTADYRARINDFVENFLYFFCHPDFTLPPKGAEIMIKLQPLIANVVAISDFGTTTPWVVRLARNRENFFKLLVLHNARSAVEIDPKKFFDVSPFLASEWWSYYWTSAAAFCTEETFDRIRRHLDALDDRFVIFGENTRASYFPVTYVAPEKEAIAKGRLNTLTRRVFSNVSIKNRPEKRKVALITGRWYRSAVYTSLSPLIKSLAGHYGITLVHFGTDTNAVLDKDMFERVICIRLEQNAMDLSALQENPWSAAIYPDIGMNAESIFLANVRIAPVQVALYGHPTSTWHSAIDYFIGGKRVEDLERARDNYSERLVVIPGMGVYPVFPDDFELPAEKPLEEPLTINCGWTAQKVSYPVLRALQEILARARRRIRFKVFPGTMIGVQNAYIPFVKDIFSMLGSGNVEVYPKQDRFSYLGELCKGAFSIDSFPFGGFNTVIDALYCRKPIVVWKGDRAFNRFGAATLETIGLPDLIANDREEYIAKVVRLIDDDGHREAVTEQVQSIDLKAAFARQENPDNFRRAIDYLIDNRERLAADQSREPVIIGEP